MLIEDTNGKKAIFGNVDFPHIKSILKKCFKNTSLFFVLAFKILHTEKVTFLKVIKNVFLSLDCFLEVLWLWKHVEKMCWKISVFFIKSKFWYDQFSIFYLDATVVGFYWDSTVQNKRRFITRFEVPFLFLQNTTWIYFYRDFSF